MLGASSPDVCFSVVEDHGGPDQFKPLAPAPVLPEARALEAKHAVGIALKKCQLQMYTAVCCYCGTAAELYEGLKGQNAVRWCFYSCHKHKSEPLHQN